MFPSSSQHLERSARAEMCGMMQGLGKTVTTIALLVSNRVDHKKLRSRGESDSGNPPKLKRLKWEEHMPMHGTSMAEANGASKKDDTAGASARKLTAAHNEVLNTAKPMNHITDSDSEQLV
jgi:hypothetical protein